VESEQKMTKYDFQCERFLTYLTAKKNGRQDCIKAMQDVATEVSLPMMTWGWQLVEEMLQDVIDSFMYSFEWKAVDENELKKANMHDFLKDARMVDISGQEWTNIVYRIKALEEQFKKVETEFTTSDEYQKCVEQDEFDLFRYETVEEVERLEKEVNELKKAMWDRFNIVDGDILRISREVSDQRKSIKNLDFKNGEYDAQFINLTDEQNDLGTRLSLVEDKVRVLSQHCNIIFTE